jgi:hypothetical protein
MRRALFLRLCSALLAALALAWPPAAMAKVTLSFHSFNGSMLFGRYPHAFVVLEGVDDATGKTVDTNYGFSAKSASPAVLAGPVAHGIYTEKKQWIAKTNRHFSVTLTDAQYARVERETAAWRDAPGKYYDLDRRNCLHFVGAIAQVVGLKVDYSKELLRKPRAWLNRVATLNPGLKAKPL